MWKSYLFVKWNSIWLDWFWQINQVIQLHSELKINIIKWTFRVDSLLVRLIGIGNSCYFHVIEWTVKSIIFFAFSTSSSWYNIFGLFFLLGQKFIGQNIFFHYLFNHRQELAESLEQKKCRSHCYNYIVDFEFHCHNFF